MIWFDWAKEHLAKWKSGLLAGGEHQDLFTPRAIQVVALARKEADRLNHNFIGTEHLLLGLIKLNRGVAVNALHKLGVNLETARAKVESIVSIGTGEKNTGPIPYTPRVKKVLALANRNAKALNHTYIGTEHLLLGLMEETDGVAAKVLRMLKVDLQQTREEILKELTPTFFPPDEGQENK
jgi:ATP-dependent Clp protease ATP-binding subunit ClpC